MEPGGKEDFPQKLFKIPNPQKKCSPNLIHNRDKRFWGNFILKKMVVYKGGVI